MGDNNWRIIDSAPIIADDFASCSRTLLPENNYPREINEM